MSNLFESFSAWAQSPTDPDAKQAVIDRAGSVAHGVPRNRGGLANVAANSERQLTQAVDHVNHLVRAVEGLQPAGDREAAAKIRHRRRDPLTRSKNSPSSAISPRCTE